MSTDTFTSLRPAVAAGLLQRVRASRWAPLPVVLAGTFMVVLDFFIVNVALPSIQSGLHASTGSIEWIVAGYGLTTAVLLITSGRLGDRYGRRRVFTVGLALFTLSSAACGFASDATVLVGARLVQGCGAALLMPNVLSIIGVLYDGADRARALAAYGMTMGLAAVSGQLIGGVLMQADPAGLSWRSCFLINVPIGAAGGRARAAGDPRVARTADGSAGPARDAAGDRRAGGDRAAARRGACRTGGRCGPGCHSRSAPAILAAFWRQQRRLAQRGGTPLLTPDAVQRTPRPVGPRRTARVLVRTGVVLPRAGAVHAARSRDERAQLGARVHDHGGVVSRDVDAGADVDRALRPPRPDRRRLDARRRPPRAAGGRRLSRGRRIGRGAGSRPDPDRRRDGPRNHAPGDDHHDRHEARARRRRRPACWRRRRTSATRSGWPSIGVVFFGAVSQGFAYAFELSLGVLAAILIVVAVLSRLLPAGVRS